MSELTIGEILAQARGQSIAVSPAQPTTKPQAAVLPGSSNTPALPDNAGQPAPATPMPAGPNLSLVERARQLPRDAARWEVLLHNAWMTDPWWFWTLATLRLGGCQIVPHIEAGWALRFNAAAIDELRQKTGDGMLFGSEAEYRAFATRALAPRREELTELLQLSSFGRLVDEDFDWAFSPAGKRRVG